MEDSQNFEIKETINSLPKKKYKFVYNCALIVFAAMQFLSFSISFIGMSLFFTEAPVDVNLLDYFNLFTRYSNVKYIIDDITVSKLEYAGCPKSITKRIATSEEIFSDVTTFKSYLFSYLNLSPGTLYNEKWVLTEVIKDILSKIKNQNNSFICNISKAELLDLDKKWKRSIEQFNSQLNLKFISSYDIKNIQDIINNCLNIQYETRNDLEKDIYINVQNEINKIIIEFLVPLCETSKTDYLFISKVLISFIISLSITCITAFYLFQIQEKGWPTWYIVLCLIFSLSLSIISGFVVTWLMNHQKEYIQQIELARNKRLHESFTTAIKKAHKLYAKNIEKMNEKEQLNIREKMRKEQLMSEQRYISWIESVVNQYTLLITLMEDTTTSQNQRLTRKQIIKRNKTQKDTFNYKYIDLKKEMEKKLGSVKNDIALEKNRFAEGLVEYLKSTEKEIYGEIGNSKSGYGTKARTHLLSGLEFTNNWISGLCHNYLTDQSHSINCKFQMKPIDKISSSEETKKISKNFNVQARKIFDNILNTINDELKRPLENEVNKIKNYTIDKATMIDKFNNDFIKTYENIKKFNNSKNSKEKRYYFESIVAELNIKLSGFNYMPMEPISIKGIHQIVLAKSIALSQIKNAYYLPVYSFNVLNRTSNNYIIAQEINNEVFFSKTHWIEEFEERTKHELSLNEKKILDSLLKERQYNLGDIISFFFAFIFDGLSIILSILLRTIKNWTGQKYIILSETKTIVTAYIMKVLSSIKLSDIDEDEKIKAKIDELNKKRINDFEILKSKEWKKMKKEKLKDAVRFSIGKEVNMMTTLQLPLEEYNNSVNAFSKFNDNLEKLFNQNVKIRRMFKDDMIEMQKYVQDLNANNKHADILMKEIYMAIEKEAYNLIEIQEQHREKLLNKVNIDYEKKASEFMEEYKERIAILLEKFEAYKVRGLINYLDDKTQKEYVQLIAQMKQTMKNYK